MRTLTTPDGKTTFHFHSDLSGDVTIQVRPQSARKRVKEIEVPGKALLDFVAQFVAGERIAHLEQASTEEILGIKDGQ